MKTASHAARTNPGPSAPAWSAQDLKRAVHGAPDKADRIRRMFGAIAHRYDLNNRLHSFGRDQAWRRAAVRLAGVKPTDRVLDVACGTGDLTRAFADAGAARIVGLDFTPEMLAIARRKRLIRAGAPDDAPPVIDYTEGDAMALPFDDGSFDIVSIAFGLRNVAEPDIALREFRRVLAPGGRLIILEFSRPTFPPIAWVHDLYCRVIMPRTAALIAGDRVGAYRYLPRSVETFASREEVGAAMEHAGFHRVIMRPMTFGVCIAYRSDA